MTSVLRAVGGRLSKLPISRRALLAIGIVVVTTTGILTVMSTSDVADAHGSLESPPSRIYYCRFFDNPENPAIPACRAAIAESGKQAVYDWNEVNQPNAGGNHRAVVPDGQLCSGGRPKYRGFDLARTDWPVTRLSPGAWYEFRPLFSAPHVGTVELYLTRDGFDATQPLRWSDLEDAPFLRITRTSYPANYTATAQLPSNKRGRHVIYMIWQRTDSPEAFYSCSDVDFGGGGPAPVPPTHDHPTPSSDPVAQTTEPTPPSDHEHHDQPSANPNEQPSADHPHEQPNTQQPNTQQPPAAQNNQPQPTGSGASSQGPTAPAWAPGTAYQVGALVRYNGRTYRCVQAHTSLVGWEPATTPALWVGVVESSPGQNPTWQPNTGYATGQVVSYHGRLYRCIQGHTSLSGWEPTNTPALWQPI